jgi:hypothetical protein
MLNGLLHHPQPRHRHSSNSTLYTRPKPCPQARPMPLDCILSWPVHHLPTTFLTAMYLEPNLPPSMLRHPTHPLSTPIRTPLEMTSHQEPTATNIVRPLKTNPSSCPPSHCRTRIGARGRWTRYTRNRARTAAFHLLSNPWSLRTTTITMNTTKSSHLGLHYLLRGRCLCPRLSLSVTSTSYLWTSDLSLGAGAASSARTAGAV